MLLDTPGQWAHWIAKGDWFDEAAQVVHERRIYFVSARRPPPMRRTRPAGRAGGLPLGMADKAQ
jgi:hypothetical protein